MQNAVNKVLEKIREGVGNGGSAFTLTIEPEGKGEKPVQLQDDQIFAAFVTTLNEDEGMLGAPFTMVLPLAQPVPLN